MELKLGTALLILDIKYVESSKVCGHTQTDCLNVKLYLRLNTMCKWRFVIPFDSRQQCCVHCGWKLCTSASYLSNLIVYQSTLFPILTLTIAFYSISLLIKVSELTQGILRTEQSCPQGNDQQQLNSFILLWSFWWWWVTTFNIYTIRWLSHVLWLPVFIVLFCIQIKTKDIWNSNDIIHLNASRKYINFMDMSKNMTSFRRILCYFNNVH